MKHVLEMWDKIEMIMDGHNIVLGFDYDGTLSPIKDTPEQAILTRENKQLLKKLTNCCTLAIVSGRALVDLKAKVNLPNIIYVGNHGLEISGPGINFESFVPIKEKKDLNCLRQILIAEYRLIKGVWVEDKGLSLSVHYRLAHESDELSIMRIFQKTCRRYEINRTIRVTLGKKVLEVRPNVDWDKGNALLWLLAKKRYSYGKVKIMPIFIGDDLTDEDALGAIRGQGLGIVVGKKENSKAGYFLKDTQEVTEFMRRILVYLTVQSTTES